MCTMYVYKYTYSQLVIFLMFGTVSLWNIVKIELFSIPSLVILTLLFKRGLSYLSWSLLKLLL